MSVTCHIVVIDELEQGNPIGVDRRFEAVPRVGEYVFDFGRVEDVTHFPSELGDPSPENRVQIMIKGIAENAGRTEG